MVACLKYLKNNQMNKQLTELIEWMEERDKLYHKIASAKLELNLIIAKAKSLQSDDGWISVEDRLPEIIEGCHYSANVIAWVNGQRQIMCMSLLNDGEDCNYVWCMVYDGLNGDGEYDDEYKPTHWQPLPEKPIH